MDIGSLLLKVHPEVMQRCECCQGHGQYYVQYSNNYGDADQDVEACEECNTLGYVLKSKNENLY